MRIPLEDGGYPQGHGSMCGHDGDARGCYGSCRGEVRPFFGCVGCIMEWLVLGGGILEGIDIVGRGDVGIVCGGADG